MPDSNVVCVAFFEQLAGTGDQRRRNHVNFRAAKTCHVRGGALAALFGLWDFENNFTDVTLFIESFLGVYDLFKWPSLGDKGFDCATLN